MGTPPDPESLLGEQLAFYRADAAAYEAWETEVFARGGGGALGARLRAERRRLLAALHGEALRGHVLELAAGTGTFTRALLETATSVTAVDASPESLALARTKLAPQADRVRFVEADLFTWRPDRRYDGVFFAYWLSHVPPGRFAAFWALVREALAPDGRVFFLDSAAPRRAPESPAPPPRRPPGPSGRYREWDALERRVSVRDLEGRRYHVVKVAWEPAPLEARLASLGWEASVRRSARSIWGDARPVARATSPA